MRKDRPITHLRKLIIYPADPHSLQIEKKRVARQQRSSLTRGPEFVFFHHLSVRALAPLQEHSNVGKAAGKKAVSLVTRDSQNVNHICHTIIYMKTTALPS